MEQRRAVARRHRHRHRHKEQNLDLTEICVPVGTSKQAGPVLTVLGWAGLGWAGGGGGDELVGLVARGRRRVLDARAGEMVLKIGAEEEGSVFESSVSCEQSHEP